MLNIKCRKMVNNLDLPFQARSKTDLFGMIMKIIHNLVLQTGLNIDLTFTGGSSGLLKDISIK